MKKILVICILLLCTFGCSVFAQNTILYSYDANGNRKMRQLYVCPNCPVGGRVAGKDTAKKTEQLAAKYGISAYPNPTLDKLNLKMNNVQSNETTGCELIDASGRSIQSRNNLTAQNELDMSNCQQGIYYLRVYVGKDVLMYKVVKVQ